MIEWAVKVTLATAFMVPMVVIGAVIAAVGEMVRLCRRALGKLRKS